MVAALTAELGEMPKGSPTLAATALALAVAIDAPGSATSKSMCAKVLQEILDRMRELAPPKKEKDRTDEFTERLRQRQAES